MKKLTYALAMLLIAGAAQADWYPGRYEIYSNQAHAQFAAYDANGIYTMPPQDIPQFGQLASSAQIAAAFQDIATALTYVYSISSSPNLNASLLNSGTVNCARMPGLTGAITTTPGSCTTALSSSSVVLSGPIVSGVLPDVNLTGNVVKYTDSGTNFSGVTPPTIASAAIATGSIGSYVGTPTGFAGATTPATVTVLWVRVGNIVTITIPGFFGTSNATTMTITGSLPVSLEPQTAQTIAVAPLLNNGSATIGQPEHITVTPGSTTLTFGFAGTSAPFTNSGTKGVSSTFSFTYQIAQ